MDPIEEVIHNSFLPSLFGRAEPLPEELKELVSLSPAQGGIGIPDLKRESLEQFNASLDITAPHVNCYSKLHYSSTRADGGKKV